MLASFIAGNVLSITVMEEQESLWRWLIRQIFHCPESLLSCIQERACALVDHADSMHLQCMSPICALLTPRRGAGYEGTDLYI